MVLTSLFPTCAAEAVRVGLFATFLAREGQRIAEELALRVVYAYVQGREPTTDEWLEATEEALTGCGTIGHAYRQALICEWAKTRSEVDGTVEEWQARLTEDLGWHDPSRVIY